MKLRLTIHVPNWLDRIFAWPVLLYRRKRYGHPFRRIHLTDGKFAIVDQQDFYWLNSFDWCLKENHGFLYAARFNNFCDNPPKILSMHREIMNAPPGILVDHRNCYGLDNRRENIRFATHAQNNCNRRKRKNASSKYTGVIFDKQTGKWRARITANGKMLSLGRSISEIDAAKAYDAAAKKYYGEFARVNFP